MTLSLWLQGGDPAKAPRGRLHLTISASPSLNPDALGHPLSMVLRIYQLKDKEEFARLSFHSAASGKPDPELLGPGFLARRDLTLLPDGLCEAELPLHPEVRFLGLVGLFRNPDAQGWRCLAPMEAPPPPPPPPPGRGFLKRMFTRRPKPSPVPPDPELTLKVQACHLELVSPPPLPLAAGMRRPGCPGTDREDASRPEGP